MRGPDSPGYRWTLARSLRVLLRPACRILYRVRVLGGGNVPLTGPAILAGNHVSYADPVMLWVYSPRRVHFMGKSELWEHRFLAWALPRVWGFPVRRGEPDRLAIRTATGLLKQGELVGMFPEGTRVKSGDQGDAHGGVAFVSRMSGAAVVPVGIFGTDMIKPEGKRLPRFPRVTISIGAPIRPEDYESLRGKEKVEAMTRDIMERIAEELERAREA